MVSVSCPTADIGYLRFCSSANHDFFIELPEVFEATAATRDNQHIRTGDFSIGGSALKPKIAAAIFSAAPSPDRHGPHQHMAGKRSSRRCRISLITAPVDGYNANHIRQEWKVFAARFEQPFGGKFFTAILE